MKAIKLMGCLLLILTTILCFSACSKHQDEPVVEEEYFHIEGKMPANLHIGMIYPISHDQKTNQCVFGLYLGENPPQDFIDAIEKEVVSVYAYDRYGKKVEYKLAGYKFDQESGTYKDGFNTWVEEIHRSEFRHDNTLTLSCYFCEQIAKFRIHFSGPSLFNYYPELKDLDDVRLDYVTSPESMAGQFFGGVITQSWSSPHFIYN